MSTFKRIATKLREGKMVIPVTLAVIIGMVIGGFAFYEDYQSSYHGYSMLPTRKSGQEIIAAIALLPQIGQIIFFYMFGDSVEVLPGGKRKVNYTYLTIAVFLFLFDVATDMVFKASGMPWDVWIIAFFESIVVFTIGSEMMLTASIGIFFELAPEALRQLGQVLGRLFGDDDEDQQQQKR